MEPSQETYGDVKEALSSLAQQLGVGVETFWPEFVKVQVFYGLSSLFITLLGFFFLWKTFKYLRAAEPYSEPFFITFGVLSIIFLIIGLITFLFGGHNYPALGACLFSPQYCAIKEVLNLVKP